MNGQKFLFLELLFIQIQTDYTIFLWAFKEAVILPVIRITYVEGWNVKKNAYFLYLCKYFFPMTKCFHFIVLPAFKK